MSKRPNYRIEHSAADHILIRDLGPWSNFPTVTNAADVVVAELSDQLNGRQLFYIDSEGQVDEILVENGAFAGFAPGSVY